MRFRSSFLVLSLATLAVACAPAAGTQALPDAGYDHSAPPLPDEPGNDSNSKDSAPGSGTAVQDSRFAAPKFTANQAAQILAKYNYVDPSKTVRTAILQNALLYFDANKSRLKNTDYLSIVDFSLPSNKPRLHVIDMKTGQVWSLHVAHGKGSDANGDAYAEKFSNESGSDASSLGAYLTAETYSGSHGLSLRMDGLSSTNSNVRSRAIVVHGAAYVQDANVKQGRSWGCFAVSMTNRTKLISMIKGGSIIFASN